MFGYRIHLEHAALIPIIIVTQWASQITSGDRFLHIFTVINWHFHNFSNCFPKLLNTNTLCTNAREYCLLTTFLLKFQFLYVKFQNQIAQLFQCFVIFWFPSTSSHDVQKRGPLSTMTYGYNRVRQGKKVLSAKLVSCSNLDLKSKPARIKAPNKKS